MTISAHVDCWAADYPFVSSLTLSGDWAAVVGKIVNPTAPKASALATYSDGYPRMVYGEFDAVIDRVLAGPQVERHLSLSFQGGATDQAVTEIGRSSQSAWAEDGSFIGFVIPDPQAPTGWAPSVVPVVDGRVVFPDVGCFQPAGLKDVDERSVSVLVFDNGTVTESSGRFPTAGLDEITRSIGR